MLKEVENMYLVIAIFIGPPICVYTMKMTVCLFCCRREVSVIVSGCGQCIAQLLYRVYHCCDDEKTRQCRQTIHTGFG